MNERSIHTGGAASTGGDVQTGRDFVGRDQITIHVTWQGARNAAARCL